MGKGHRQGRLGEEIRKIISNMLISGIKDPRLSGMISITAVEVTSDGSYATCYVSILGSGKNGAPTEEEKKEVLAGFKSVSGLIKREIGHQIKLRHIPELIFKIDSSMEYGRHIDDILSTLEIKHDDEEEE